MKHAITLILFTVLSVLSIRLSAQQYEKQNLGAQVNSKVAELTPLISPDGRKLFFIREDHPDNGHYPENSQEIWFSELSSSGQWSKAKLLGYPFNTGYKNSIVGISTDGNTRIVKGYYRNGEYQKSGFSLSRLTTEGWSVPRGFDVKSYDKMCRGKYVSSCLSADGEIMMLSFSEQKNGTVNDLYVTFRENDRSWSKPIPLKGINTKEYDEISPFLAPDNKTLYFSSNRPGGHGNCDIYVSRRLDDTWQSWSEPKNMGPDVNTSDWDAYFTIPASGEYAYMVSSKNSLGSSDIVRLKLKEEVKPEPVVLVKGRALDAKTREPIAASILCNLLPEGTLFKSFQTNPRTGEYQFILTKGNNYAFNASSSGYYPVSESFDARTLDAYKEIERDLMLVPIEVGQVVRLNNIFFDFGKATLQPESYPELNNVAKLLQTTTMKIAIAGHTDNVGSDDFNLKLSKDRAAAVYEYLVSQGVEASRLSSDGFGKTKPVADNATEEGRALNRRVEFTIESK